MAKKTLQTTGVILLIIGAVLFSLSFATFGQILTYRDTTKTESFRAGEQIRFIFDDKVTMPLEKCDEAQVEVILLNGNDKIYFGSEIFSIKTGTTQIRKVFYRDLNPSVFKTAKGYEIEARVLCKDSGNNVPSWHILTPTSKAYVFIDKQRISTCTVGTFTCTNNKETEMCQLDNDGNTIKNNIGVVIGNCGVKCRSSSQCTSNERCTENKCVKITEPLKDDDCNDPIDTVCEGNQIQKQQCNKLISIVETCSADEECVNAQCIKEKDNACADKPIIPCERAEWEDYPTCQWDNSLCVVGCTKDITKTCADGKSILQAECINGELNEYKNSCPLIECSSNAECSKGWKCNDGTCDTSKIVVEKGNTNQIFMWSGIGVMVIALILLGISFFRKKR